MDEQARSASRELAGSAWPRYSAAVEGFRNYWYPVALSGQVGRKPVAVTVCGEQVVLVRDGGRVYGLNDRCPHRGVKLSAGRCRFSGLLTCAYHGWTYDLATGELVAALTDGPDSPIVGKDVVRVRSYPVEERAGLVWVYVGEQPPPPVEEDIPQELLRPDAVVFGLAEVRPGNWRYGIENAIDEGHAKYLHRGALWSFFREFPAWTRVVRMAPSEDGRWLMRHREQTVWQDTYPRIGTWPPKDFWRSKGQGIRHVGVRLPCIFRGWMGDWMDYELYVPVDASRHLAVMLAVKWTRGLGAALWRLRYWLHIRPLYYWLFQRGQDQWMVEQTNIPPERLYRPDVSITAWRKWCHERARGAAPGTESGGEVVSGPSPLPVEPVHYA
jgi:phenylpropionate dioxygenase-like ring-hydroxylating dioxygenase large terminal subunit